MKMLKGLVFAALAVLSLGVAVPGLLWASDCEDACLGAFGECKACSGPWEGYNGEFSHCAGTTCYYVCGSACKIHPE